MTVLLCFYLSLTCQRYAICFFGLGFDNNGVELRLLRSVAYLYPHFALRECGKATE